MLHCRSCGKFSSNSSCWQISREIELLIRFASFWLRYKFREAEGNKGRKKIFLVTLFLSLFLFLPSHSRSVPTSARWKMDGWIPSLSSRTPVCETGQTSSRPQNLSAERAYFHLTRLAGRLILLKTSVTRFRALPQGIKCFFHTHNSLSISVRWARSDAPEKYTGSRWWFFLAFEINKSFTYFTLCVKWKICITQQNINFQ